VKPPDWLYLGAFFWLFFDLGAVWVQFDSSIKHQVVHQLSSFFLPARYEMTIDIKRNAGLGMSEPLGDD
jgi:hypothetical protein